MLMEWRITSVPSEGRRMRLFSMPADFRTETIDRYAELNSTSAHSAVAEVYGQATVGAMSRSGRNSALLPAIDLRALQLYVQYCHSRHIDFNYTLNPSCLGNLEFTDRGLKQISRLLQELWNIGIRHLTVSMPQIISIIHDSSYPFNIKASAISQIDSPYKAKFYKQMGVQRIVVDENIVRDFSLIRSICREFGEGVELIANSVCVRDCPYKMFHYNHESHYSFSSQDIKGYFTHSCAVQKISDVTIPMFLNWIRPEDLLLYEDAGIHRFKLQGRQGVLQGDPVRAVRAYAEGTYDGNLLELLHLFDKRQEKWNRIFPLDNKKLEGFLTPFSEDADHCTRDCDSCGYCSSYSRLAFDWQEAESQMRSWREKLGKEEPFQTHLGRPAYHRLGLRQARRAYSLWRNSPLAGRLCLLMRMVRRRRSPDTGAGQDFR
jgi:collagenase-like PrtC family protease